MIKIMWAAVLGGAGLVLACTAGGLTAGSAWAQPTELPAQVVTLGGPAELHKKGAPAWGPAALRDELGAGDSVRTQVGGRITLKTASGQAVRLGSRSQVAILASELEAGPTRVRLDNGWLWVAVSPNSPPPTQIEVRAG
ncbi:MAG: FecR domain-containing protein, partial [Candidatus Rokuibacteriota bacterium]